MGTLTGAPEKVASGKFLAPRRDSEANLICGTEQVPPGAPLVSIHHTFGGLSPPDCTITI